MWKFHKISDNKYKLQNSKVLLFLLKKKLIGNSIGVCDVLNSSLSIGSMFYFHEIDDNTIFISDHRAIGLSPTERQAYYELFKYFLGKRDKYFFIVSCQNKEFCENVCRPSVIEVMITWRCHYLIIIFRLHFDDSQIFNNS